MELEVLARHRGHHADVEPAVPGPFQREPVRRRLHDDASRSPPRPSREELLELERLGRRRAPEVRFGHRDPVAGGHGPDLAGMPPTVPQHLGGQRRHRRLPVGARDADDRQLLRRSAVPGVGGIGQRATRAVDDQLRGATSGSSRSTTRRPRPPRPHRQRSRGRRRGPRERRRTASPVPPAASRRRGRDTSPTGMPTTRSGAIASVRAPRPMWRPSVTAQHPAASPACRSPAQPVQRGSTTTSQLAGPLHLPASEALLEQARRRATGARARRPGVRRPTGRAARTPRSRARRSIAHCSA